MLWAGMDDWVCVLGRESMMHIGGPQLHWRLRAFLGLWVKMQAEKTPTQRYSHFAGCHLAYRSLCRLETM